MISTLMLATGQAVMLCMIRCMIRCICLKSVYACAVSYGPTYDKAHTLPCQQRQGPPRWT